MKKKQQVFNNLFTCLKPGGKIAFQYISHLPPGLSETRTCAAESREYRSYFGYVSLWGEDKDRAVLFIGRIWNNPECSDWMRRTGIWIRWGASQMALVDYTWWVWYFPCYWRATTKVSSSLHWWKRKALSWLSRNETWNACMPTPSHQEGIGARLKMCCFSLEKETKKAITDIKNSRDSEIRDICACKVRNPGLRNLELYISLTIVLLISLNFIRLLWVVITPSLTSESTGRNAVRWRHYSFALIHAKSKPRFSSGKARNIVWKCPHDTEELTIRELLCSFRS